MSTDLAQHLMQEFADSTGLTGTAPPRRYLWTDAFAVCNYLGLHRTTGDERYLTLARDLIQQVHHILGRHRPDDRRTGWISGLPEQEGERHPTRGGLRIGKPFNERGPEEPFDSHLEWELDGQYFHYLTKWMHALFRANSETAEYDYARWAAELAIAAHDAFTYDVTSGGPRRMFWKMSIALDRPLVDSMGHHDPLDGLITCLELQAAETSADQDARLARAIADFEGMCAAGSWATDDPLGIGGLLDGATRLAQMVFVCGENHRKLLVGLLEQTEVSLRAFSRTSAFDRSADARLAFRELGLSIGLRGLPLIARLAATDQHVSALLENLLLWTALADRIDAFWSDAANRSGLTWNEHRDINSVMLATSLSPDGYLLL